MPFILLSSFFLFFSYLAAVDSTNICSPVPAVNFWAQFSVRLAQASEGTVFYLPDNNRDMVYKQTSFFKCYEVPNFDPNNVTRLVTLNVHPKNSGSQVILLFYFS